MHAASRAGGDVNRKHSLASWLQIPVATPALSTSFCRTAAWHVQSRHGREVTRCASHAANSTAICNDISQRFLPVSRISTLSPTSPMSAPSVPCILLRPLLPAHLNRVTSAFMLILHWSLTRTGVVMGAANEPSDVKR